MRLTFLFLCITSSAAFGWGELGHQLVARTAAKLIASHPLLVKARKDADKDTQARIDLFIDTMEKRHFQMGHLTNIPDIYWRDLEGGLKEQGTILGNTSHHMDIDRFLPTLVPNGGFAGKIPWSTRTRRRCTNQ